jgi:O-antigen/teichoic acid export membrane protein
MNLKQKAFSSVIWSAFQKYSQMLILFISDIILARLLTPFDYGCIGLLAIFMLIAETFISGGFGSALIQKKHTTQEDYSTIFFWNLGMSIVLYAVLYLTAPFIANFYHIPLLASVLRVQGIVLFIYAFNLVQRNLLRKNLNFKVISIVTIVTSVTSLTVTIAMAYNGYGVWSLVAQNILTAAIPAIVFWFYVKWRPVFIFSWKSFKELFSFGFYMFLIELLGEFAKQVQGLLIGRFYNPTIMGYYSKAASTERVSSVSISLVMTQITYPLYASIQDDKEVLKRIVRRLTMTLAYLTFPLMFILMLCAKPIFIILYTERWLPCVPYFQILCLSGLALCLQTANYQSITAIGKSKVMFEWTVVKRIVGISFIILGWYLFGINGLLVGMVLHTWFSYAVNVYLVSNYIGYKWLNQLCDLFPILLASILSAIFSFLCGYFFNFELYADGILKLISFLMVYLSWSIFVKPEAFVYCWDVVASQLKKKSNTDCKIK